MRTDLRTPHRFEQLRPRQLEQLRAACPVALFPFGTLEHHGRHLPVGLDAIKAHEILLALSARIGAVVMPPLFYGTGGGHADYDWTILAPAEHLGPIIEHAFVKMYEFGFTVQVALTGHYPPEQKTLVAEAGQGAVEKCPGLQIWTGPEYAAVPDMKPTPGDHAGKWETSILQALRPELVNMTELHIDGRGRPVPYPAYADESQGRHAMSDDRDDPLYGIAGLDPRAFASAQTGAVVVTAILDGLETWARQALQQAHRP